MQKHSLIHRDIKPSNILIHNNSVKLGDFGFAKEVKDVLKSEKMTMLGTYEYLSP